MRNLYSYETLPITLTGSNVSIKSAPGAKKRILVYGYQLTCSTGGSITFKSASTAKSGAMPLDKGIATMSPNLELPLIIFGENEAASIDISSVVGGGVIQVAVEQIS